MSEFIGCVDCAADITGKVHYGAGDGKGQRFRCEPCHRIAELESALATAQEALRKLVVGKNPLEDSHAGDRCKWCNQVWGDEEEVGHKDDCAWLEAVEIVAALPKEEDK